MDQVLVQRVFAARDLNEGRLGATFCGYLKITTPFLLVLPGLIARALFPNLSSPDKAYPALLQALMPAGLLGLTVAGIAAALMGHLSATYNSVATLLTRDFYLRWRPGASQEQQVRAGRWTVLAVFALGALWAPVIGRFESLWIYLQSVGAYLMMPFVAVFYLGVLWRRVTTQGVIASADHRVRRRAGAPVRQPAAIPAFSADSSHAAVAARGDSRVRPLSRSPGRRKSPDPTHQHRATCDDHGGLERCIDG